MMRSKYPDKIPIGLEQVSNLARTNLEHNKHQKLIVPESYTFAEIMWIIRKERQLAYDEEIFLMAANKTAPKCSDNVTQIYSNLANQDADGFLHITYSCEKVGKNELSKVHQMAASLVIYSIFSNINRQKFVES